MTGGQGSVNDVTVTEGLIATPRIPRPGGSSLGRTPIIAAAARVFMEKGYSAASIDDIADLLGSTKGRIYHYYRSKIDIYLEIHHEALTLMMNAVTPLSTTSRPAPERLYGMALEHVRLLIEHMPLQRVAVQGLGDLSTVSANQEATRNMILSMRDMYEELFVNVIRDGVESGEFSPVDPGLAVKPLLGALNWTTVWYRPSGDPSADTARLTEALALFVCNALRP